MRRRNTFIDKTGVRFLINSVTGKTATKAVISGLEREEIKKALKALKRDHRHPFMLYFSGYKYEEIAKKLNIPLGTVKTRIYKARKQLKASLSDYQKT